MNPERDHDIGLDRRKLTFHCFSKTLPHREPSPSAFECSGPVAFIVAMTMIIGDGKKQVHYGESGYKKRKARVSTLFRSGVLLCQYLAIIFLLAGSPSVVRAQAQNDTTKAPSVSSNVAVTDPTPSETVVTETIAPLPTTTTITAPTVPPSVPGPSLVTPSIPTPPPTPVITTTIPSRSQTLSPTRTMKPSNVPSGVPSSAPTGSVAPSYTPTEHPTIQPTWLEASSKESKFRQEFKVGNGREFNDDEIGFLQVIYKQLTEDFAPLTASEVESKITTICTVDRQEFLIEVGGRRLQGDTGSDATPQLLRRRGRRLQDAPNNPNVRTINVDYTMKYESKHYNVTQYPKLFQNWTNSNLDKILEALTTLKMNVTEVDGARRIVVSTPAPSYSVFPSAKPTVSPTITPVPSSLTEAPIDTSDTIMTGDDDPKNNVSLNIIIIAVSLIIAFSIIVIGVFVYYRKRRVNRLDDFGANSTKRSQIGESKIQDDTRWAGSATGAPNPSYGTSETKAYGSSFGKHLDMPSRSAGVVSSGDGSLVSSQSLISRGNSMGGDSRDESDSAHILVDEFDQYKDQNLEKMRADIEDLPECDGMMSQAVAKALIDQDDDTVISYWGGNHDITAPEIEASALGFVLDWLKRNAKISDREKREMIQEQLNKMTASVLHKVIGPDDATRTIHECAVLLGLKLASELSVTTILISGMRKKATEADIRRTFSVFGDVAVAAVAPNERGFGILRFRSNNAVNRAMGKFRTEEVVVEDVAVQLLAIRAGSNMRDTEGNGVTKII